MAQQKELAGLSLGNPSDRPVTTGAGHQLSCCSCIFISLKQVSVASVVNDCSAKRFLATFLFFIFFLGGVVPVRSSGRGWRRPSRNRKAVSPWRKSTLTTTQTWPSSTGWELFMTNALLHSPSRFLSPLAPLQVSAVPTVLAIRGGDVVDRFVGIKDDDQLDSFVSKVIGKWACSPPPSCTPPLRGRYRRCRHVGLSLLQSHLADSNR